MSIADHWKSRRYDHSLRPLLEVEVRLWVDLDRYVEVERRLASYPAYPLAYGAEPVEVRDPEASPGGHWDEIRARLLANFGFAFADVSALPTAVAAAAHLDEADTETIASGAIRRAALLVGPEWSYRTAAEIDWGLLRDEPAVPSGLTLRVRRWDRWAEPRASGTGLPLQICVDARLRADADRLFDPLVQASREQGVIAWDFHDAPWSAKSRVVHIEVADGTELRRHVSELGDGVSLVVLREPRRQFLFGFEIVGMRDVVDGLLERGVHAVVVVAADDPLADGFFAEFYRGLMHNHPIDEAAARALAERVGTTDVWVSMRRGGEFSLLLTHALAREDREGPRRVKPERYRSGTSPRADQIAAWVQGRITTAVDRTTSLKDARLVQLEGTAFDQEVHTIAEVAAARTLVREVHALRELEARVNVEGGANAATLRAATAWVERGDERLAADAVVAVGEPHVLAVAIETHVRDYARTVVPFREEGIAEALRAAGEVELAAVVFADPTELEFTTGSAPLRLPIVGDSTTARLGFTARRPGAARVRVALYFRGQVLQSFALELACGEALPEGTGVSGIDWALTTDFAALDLLPAGGQTILVNDGPDGSHWFMARDREGGPLLRKYDDAQLGVWLKPLTTRLASALEQWNGEPFDPEKPRWDERADELVALARLGWSAYFKLFKDLVAEGTPDVGTDGRLTIARCEFSRYNPPWAALYRHKLDVTAGDIGLCPTFRARVEATEWSTEEIGEVELPAPAGGYHLPLLDEQACRAAAGCPLADPSRALRTVCPYGFLGMRGVLEQPLQDVPPGSKQHLDPGFTLPSVLASANPAVRIGYDRELMLSKDHAASIAKLFAPSREVTEQRDEVLRWIRHGGAQVLYVFCHAETLELSAEFGLRFGDDEFIVPSLVGFISKDPPFADDVPRPWPGGALVMLNGCDTVAPVTASLGDFVTLLRQLGAVGIVGTETPVETPIASEFGLRLLALLRGGEALGSAMLKLRRAFLWQMNPVGLTYTFYASASLHMHMSGRTCEICPEATS